MRKTRENSASRAKKKRSTKIDFSSVSDKYNSFHWELLASSKVDLSQVYINLISDVIVSNLSLNSLLSCRLENEFPSKMKPHPSDPYQFSYSLIKTVSGNQASNAVSGVKTNGT